MERAITLYQPIASLMVRGIKTVETRCYPTKVRGSLWIHSAKAFPADSWIEKYAGNPVFRFYALGSHRWDIAQAIWRFKEEADFVRAAIVGRVNLVDCIEGKHARARLGTLDYRRERALGDIDGPDRFGWLTRDAEELKKPVPASGLQGFWDATQYLRDLNPSYK